MKAGSYNLKLQPPMFSRWEPKNGHSAQIAVLMSGGVDSSVAANLLKDAGWDVLGITMQIPVTGCTDRGCCGSEAAFVCKESGLAHYFVDVTEAFQRLIIKPFRQSYAKGMTPNPCADCNTLLKFSILWDFVQAEFGIDYLATGHYARVEKSSGQPRLKRAEDKSKDQSYFLYGIPAGRLDRFLLPLGELTKQEVRGIAGKLDLRVAEKAESMELCFAGEGDYRTALDGSNAERQGVLTDMHGGKIGTHRGISNYTLGQRRGIGFAGGKPLYVGKIDAQANTVALGTREEVSTRTVKADGVNVLAAEELVSGVRLFGKIRSYGEPMPCMVVDADEAGMTVEFDEAQFAPCSGQKLVLYDGNDNVVAGGTITLI